jgi:hypothetical protein
VATLLNASAVKPGLVAAAIASWVSLGYFAMFAAMVATSRSATPIFMSLVACSALWLVAILLLWGVRCPICRGHMFLVAQMPGSTWALAREQFWPLSTLRRANLTCPNCHSTSSLS